MASTAILGSVVTDHFPLYELDGTTKHSGITAFTTVIWLNGVVSAVVGTVAEIGTSGEYKVSFTPTSAGLWSWETTNTYNDDVYGGSCDVIAANVKFEMTASDNGVLASFGIWMTQDGVRVTNITTMTLTARSSSGSSINIFTPNSSCTTEGVFKFTCAAGFFTSDVEYYLDITATRTTPAGSWSSNLGFTKV
jgi:hypothetical protein